MTNNSHYSLSHKQYVWLASVWRDIRQLTPSDCSKESRAIDDALEIFVSALANAHENFDRERFLKNVNGPFTASDKTNGSK